MFKLAKIRSLARSSFAATCLFTAASAVAQHAHHHETAKAESKPAPQFIASTAKPFSALMDDAMAVMDDGMKRAPMNGVPEHDFITMMIPHHQGAIDMAKAVLLNTTDPELRNLAQGIITEQQNEIRVMQAWLARYPEKQTGHTQAPK
jgi:uncharacterized protein (DUF305 family)